LTNKNIFKIESKYNLAGDQPKAVDALIKGLEAGKRNQVLLGATGTGKTFTMANIIARTNRPAIIMAHNKTLAAQLYSEMKSFCIAGKARCSFSSIGFMHLWFGFSGVVSQNDSEARKRFENWP